VWRIVESEWPRQSVGPNLAATQGGLSAKAVDLIAAFDGCARLAMAAVATFYDVGTAAEEGTVLHNGSPAFIPAPAAFEILRALLAVVLAVTTFPYLRLKASDPQPTAWTWGRWTTTATTSILLCFGLLLRGDGGLSYDFTLRYTQQFKVMTFVYAGLGVVQLGLAAVDMIVMRNTSVAEDLDFASTAAASFAAILNPVKLIPDYGEVFIGIADVVMWGASSVLAFVALGYDSETLAREVPAMAA
jgi:hypothetical protein